MSNGMKPQFVTSDWHIQHKNIIKFSNRPFKDVDHMSEALIRNYNATVPVDGVCYFLGDMGMGSGDHVEKVVARLHGVKILVLGNHDKGMNAMYDAGFAAVMYGLRTVIGNEVVTMSHCPLFGVYREDTTGMKNAGVGVNWHGEDRKGYDRFFTKDEGQFHLHGHIHSPNGGRSERICGKQMDVGVDANDYRPVSFSRIEAWIAEYKRTHGDKK